MPTPRATQARDELGLKARLHGTPPDDVGPDDVGLDAGSSLREGTGLWGWLGGPWRFTPAPRGYVHLMEQSCRLPSHDQNASIYARIVVGKYFFDLLQPC